MARPLRIEFADGFYHVTSRGNDRAHIYLDAQDRRDWLDMVGLVADRFKWRIHAYCQMGNHFHILVQTPSPNLCRCMRQLNGLYSQRFNRRHGRVGHLLQGRYHAVIIDRDSHLLEVIRYTLLNPVRAGMVSHPSLWPWSSFLATVGEGGAPSWLAVDEVLKNFAPSPRIARRGFLDFMDAAGSHGSPWDQVTNGIYLGDAAFVERAQAQIQNSRLVAQEVPFIQRQPASSKLDDFFVASADARSGAVAAYLSGQFTMRQIAEYLGKHYSTVSRWLARKAMRDCKT